MYLARLAIVASLGAAGVSAAQVPSTAPPPAAARVFVFVQRTPAHVGRSSSEEFREVVGDLFNFLESRSVAIAEDTFGGRRFSENQLPFSTVDAIAAASGATDVLYVVVDRPISDWIRVTLECRRANGDSHWEATVDASWLVPTPGWAQSRTLSKLHEVLDQHLGQAGLPLRTSAPQAPVEQPDLQSVVVAEGTEIQLRLAQEIDVRASHVGDPVELALTQELLSGNAVVAPPGARALGVIADIHAVDPRGDSGDVRIRLTALRAGERAIPLHGEFAAQLPVATPITGYVGDDTSEPSSVAQLRIPAGTRLQFVVTQPIASDKLHAGDPVHVRAVGDLRIDDFTVIADRAPALGTVIAAKAARWAWRRGELAWRLDSVASVNGEQVPLAYVSSLVGPPTRALEVWTEAIMRTYLLAVFVLPFAPLQHGNEARVPQGTLIEATTANTAVLDRATIAANQPRPTTRTGPALVTVYSPSTSGKVDIRCNNAKLFELKSGHKTTLELEPGGYEFRVGHAPPISLVVRDGEDYFLKLWLEAKQPGSRNWEDRFEQVSRAVGAAESEWLKSVPPQHVERCTPRPVPTSPRHTTSVMPDRTRTRNGLNDP